MADDTIPLPPELASDRSILYRGTWLTETRQAVELRDNPNATRREIWVRLPSGRDKKWCTYEPVFSALEGHEVGALAWVTSEGNEVLVGMVNYNTGESRVFWTSSRPGCGCVLWLLLFVSLALVERGGAWRLIVWCIAFLVLTIASVIETRGAKKERILDKARLKFLAEEGKPR